MPQMQDLLSQPFEWFLGAVQMVKHLRNPDVLLRRSGLIRSCLMSERLACETSENYGACRWLCQRLEMYVPALLAYGLEPSSVFSLQRDQGKSEVASCGADPSHGVVQLCITPDAKFPHPMLILLPASKCMQNRTENHMRSYY